LAIQEKALGREHPLLAETLDHLAMLERGRGKFAVAEPLFQRSLAIREKVLGPDHPSTASSREHYAVLLRKTDRPAEADQQEGRARVIRTLHAKMNPAK
jgi:hypothetical protein